MEATRNLVNKITEEYVTSLDPYVPHYENITRHLRHPVISLTQKIILNDVVCRKEHEHPIVTDDENDDDDKAKNNATSKKNHNFTNLKTKNVPENSDDNDTSSPTTHLSDIMITTMNTFLHNCTLALPPQHKPSPPSSPPTPVSSRRHSKSPPRKKQSPAKQRHSSYPQFTHSDILTRLSLYAQYLHRISRTSQNRVFHLEPVRHLSSRVDLLVTSYVAHQRPQQDGTVVVAGGSLRSVEVTGGVVSLKELISGLTKELLGAEVLAPSVTKLINRLISHYSSQTSTSLPLCLSSSPTTSANHHLPPLLRAYLIHLKQNYKALILDCDIEFMLVKAIDDDLRQAFNNVIFGCVSDVWEFCRVNKEKLEGMKLPPLKEGRDCALLQQAVRDLKRERIMVNGRVLPVVESLGELVRQLTEAVNGGETKYEEEEMGDQSNVMGRHVVEGRTIDRLTSRLLCAAGRTGAGGDAYFVVNALFGGDDVAVIPSSSTPSSNRIPSRTGQYSTHQKTINEKNDNGNIPSTKQQPLPGGTIEIDVRLTSITIKCHGIYDIHPSGRNDEDFLADRQQPLIRLHAVTTEMISLQTLRARDVVEDLTEEEDKKEDDYDSFEEEEGGKSCCGAGRFLLRERLTEMTGLRRLSITPVSHDI